MRFLYFSSSVGLGHVTRDYRLGLELKRRGHEITWISSGRALQYLEHKGEKIHRISYELKSLGDAFQKSFKGGRLAPGVLDALSLYRTYAHNKNLLRKVNFSDYDAVISDEGWEILGVVEAFFITDFEGFPASFGAFGNYFVKRLNSWYTSSLSKNIRNYYVGLAKPRTSLFKFFGQLYTHEGAYPESREKGYVLFTYGGTDAGRFLYSRLRRELGSLLVTLDPERSEYKFNPIPLMAEASAIITMAGYGTLLEISAMKKRAIILYPYRDFEQENNARLFEGRKGYRVLRMDSEASFKELLEDLMKEDPDPPEFKDSAKEIADDIEEAT